MSDPTQVLIVIDHLGAGGAQEFVCQLCEYAPPDRFQISVYALRSGGVYFERLAALGVAVKVLAPGRSLIYLPLITARLLLALRSGHYHLVHTILQGAFAIATPLSHLARIPTLHSIMATRRQLQGWYFPLLTRLQRWVSLYATPIPSELISSGIDRDKIKLVEVTANIVPLLSVRHDSDLLLAPYDLADTYPVVMSIGRLHPDKGHEFAVRGWPAVAAHWPKARLLIVGTGEDELRLKRIANEIGVSNSVIFAGYRSDLTDLLTRADIILRTSINEGVNLTTIQAMAAGVPVIGFAAPVPKELITHRVNGLLASWCDPAALAAAIDELSGDDVLRQNLRAAGRNAVRDYYDIHKVIAFYEAAYTAIRESRSVAALADMSDSMRNFSKYFSDEGR
jgi:glycosyltransferase involved in cell wall biosynthesis